MRGFYLEFAGNGGLAEALQAALFSSFEQAEREAMSALADVLKDEFPAGLDKEVIVFIREKGGRAVAQIKLTIERQLFSDE